MPVVHRDGEHSRHHLASGEEVQVGFADLVIPADRPVVGVANGVGDREGLFNCCLLICTQHQGGGAIGQLGAHRLGGFRRHRAIGQIQIRKGDRTAVAQRYCAFGDAASDIHNRDGRCVIAAGDGDRDVIRRRQPEAVGHRDRVGQRDCLTGRKEIKVGVADAVAPTHRPRHQHIRAGDAEASLEG